MTDEQERPPAVRPEEVEDLRDRLRRFRPVRGAGGPAGLGVDPEWLAGLIAVWRDDYDWAAHEREIRARPWRLVETTGGPLRLLHHRVHEDAPTVVLLHGWPDSVLRFDRLVPLLDDANLVIPALPGFPFAAPVPDGGLRAADSGRMVAEALERLGIRRYAVSAGDVGTDVAEGLLPHAGAAITALHLTDVSQYHFLHGLPSDLTEEERAYVRRGRGWQEAEGGYMHEQSTKPRTLSVGLGDSPAGLLAWIGEKLDTWTDHDGPVAEVFSDDELLTWVSAYWFSGAIGTSFTPYAVATPKPSERVETPTVLTVFPKDLVNAPRSFAERLFAVHDFIEPPRGGHFAAWERPEDYEAGVRAALRAGGAVS